MKKILSIVMSFLLGCAAASASAENGIPNTDDGQWGNLKGQIFLTGEVPEIPAEKIDKDQTTCLTGEAPKDDKLIVGKNGELKNVFVMMYLKSSSKVPPVHPSYDAMKKEPVVIDNKDCRFVPHATFVRTGQELQLKNSDDAGHNCHIVSFKNEKNVTLPAGSTVKVVLDSADKAPGNVVCDIHSWMDGVILVRDEPYVAISAEDGTFEIKNIPAGDWKFQFWHKKSGYLKKLEIEGYDVDRRGSIELKIENGKTLDLGKLELPSSALK